MAERSMEIASLLLREGVLRRDDPDHRLAYEELGRDSVLLSSLRERLAAVGYDLIDDLGHLGVRPSLEAETAWPARNRTGLNAQHVRLIAYLWTQLVYREIVNLRHGLQSGAPAQISMLDEIVDDDLFVSYRVVWTDFSQRMPANQLKGALRLLRRHRFIRYDEKRDRIWADAALYVLIDRTRMETFVVDLARRLGSETPAEAVVQTVLGSATAPETDEDAA